MIRINELQERILLRIMFLSFFLFSAVFTQEKYDKWDSQSTEYLSSLEENMGNLPDILHGLPADSLLILAKIASEDIDESVLTNIAMEFKLQFKQGLHAQVLVDQLETNTDPMFRQFLLSVLLSSHKYFTISEKKMVYLTVKKYIIKDLTDVISSILSLGICNRILGDLYFNNYYDEFELEKFYSEYLQPLILNRGAEPKIRASAIHGVRNLEYEPAENDLLSIVSNTDEIQNVPTIRAACITLGFFKSIEAIPYIQTILEQTENEYVFASAAIALGDIGGEESLKILINNEQKFANGDYCGVAIRKLDTMIMDILREPDQEMLPYAIKATYHFYEGYHGQVNKESPAVYKGELDYKSLLKSILFETNDPEIIRLILKRLEQIISKDEAKEIIDRIPINQKYKNELRLILIKANAISIKGKKSNRKIENQFFNSRGNLFYQEYGDPGYRDLVFMGLEWLGHTGIFAGIDSYHDLRIIEVTGEILGSNNYVVEDRSWSGMIEGGYWGAYTLNNNYMTFSMRRNVLNTAVELIGYNIGYPTFGINLLNYYSNAGTWVNTWDVEKLRCDGLVEYCYEWNSYYIWGKNGDHHDVSFTDFVEEHNDLFAVWPFNPNEELAPVVQCGGNGNPDATGFSTNMTEDAIIDFPTYNVSYSQNGLDIILTITATDKSGIHIIGYAVGSDYWSYSPTQPQHANSSSYSYTTSLYVQNGEIVYYYAIDNGGNSPEYAESVLINITTDCAGVPGGSAYYDDCGECVGGTTGMAPNWAMDDCNVCFGNNESMDCANICDGSAYFDNCGECVGGTTGMNPNWAMDCANVCWGYAYFDSCDQCVGGTTGMQPNWAMDDCGICFGNNASMDCANVCYGSAYYDECGCVGGTTGLEPGWCNGGCNVSFYHSSGWNLLGLPVITDCTFEECYPNGISGTCWEYSDHYVPCSNLQPGVGYWGRFNNSGNDDFSGDCIETLTLNLNEGWNLISGLSTSADLNCLNDPTGCVIEGTLWEYNGGYQSSANFEPGRGYWVRANDDCTVTLDCSPARINIPSTFISRLSLANELVFTDAEGNRSIIYFGVEIPEEEELSYTLPPIPSLDLFDIRFAGDLIFAETEGLIEITNNNYPLTIDINFLNNDTKNWQLINPSNGEVHNLSEHAQIVFYEDVGQLYLRKSPASPPSEYAMIKAYPNPFNPITTIVYTIKMNQHVILDVYDVSGRLIENLVDNDISAGYHTVNWNASDQASGVYFIKMITGDEITQIKLMYLK